MLVLLLPAVWQVLYSPWKVWQTSTVTRWWLCMLLVSQCRQSAKCVLTQQHSERHHDTSGDQSPLSNSRQGGSNEKSSSAAC